ncbi:hypothetical protein ACJIZ3_004318 [Penstemon smallii]|uniref:RING-type E3 ubiquitin transferase n=1 Tax=Penstemon smallii TaxID=265156 RepID=A0ABD3S1X9_9LAMI
MDRFSGQRGAMAPQKGYNVAFKEAAPEKKDQNAQFCNRKGCSGKLKYSQNTRVETSVKAKWSHPPIHSSNGNEITKNSSKNSAKKSYVEFDPSESSLSSESVSPLKRHPTESMKRSGKFTVTEVGSSSVSPDVGPRKTFHHKLRLHNQNAPSVTKCSSQGPIKTSNGSKYVLRNMRCNSKSDIVPPNRSMSDLKSLGKNVMKNKTQQGESSSSSHGGKNIKINAASPSTSGISISDSTSVRSRRPMNVNSRTSFSSYRQNGRNGSSFRDPALCISQTPDISSSGSSSYSLSSSNSDGPLASSEMGFTRYNMDGISEVLLALERMEQNEELTHEQILALETSLFLSGLNLYDQHRDMRLDIDNMSYEELLALEEKMGSVSTALPKETLFKCFNRGTYQATKSQVRVKESDEVEYDTKCSICQEEYEIGDKIGKLVECEHGFHETCIVQWLGVKNWCPICKASAAPS